LPLLFVVRRAFGSSPAETLSARRAARAALAAALCALAVGCGPRRAPLPPSPDTAPRAAPDLAPPPHDSLPGEPSAEAEPDSLATGERASARVRRSRRARPVTARTARERLPPSPPVSSAPIPGAVRVCAGGDVTLGTNLDTVWTIAAERRLARSVAALPPPARLLAPLAPLVRDADVVLLNVEGAIGDAVAVTAKCAAGSVACFALRQPAATAAALRGLAPHAQVVGNVANNHARDAGLDGLQRTTRHLSAAGVHVTGVDTLATPVRTTGGDTVAFLGFSTSAPPDARHLAAVRRHVARAAARYPRLVVTAHLGAEGAGAQRTRDSVERYAGEHRGNPIAFANAAVAGGATLVVMHGPHVLRAVQWRGERLVAYSLGNLVTYGPFSFNEPLRRGAVLCASLDAAGRVRRPALGATRQQRPGVVALDPTGRAYVLVDSLSRLDFPRTGVRVTRDGMLLRPPVPRRDPR
jgi:hypothetical protein